MGYDLHITRAEDWLDAKSSPITIEQWTEYVDSDPEMRIEGQAVGTVDGHPTVEYQNEGLAVWVAYSQHDPNGNMAWFDYHNGQVIVKNPDDEILGKMKQIAEYLGANVFGDDGEPY